MPDTDYIPVQDRIAAHQARIQADLAQAIKEERASILRRRQRQQAKSPPLNFAGRPKRAKVRKLTRHQKWQKYWMEKLDRIEAMARNPGWST